LATEKTEKKPAAQNLTKALSKAESIIAAAEQRAAEILAKADESLVEAKELAYKEGVDIARKEIATSAVRMIEESSLINERLSNEAAKLAVAICSSVIGEHVKAEPETVKKIAHKALRESVVGNKATIIVNPEDEKIIKSSLKDFERLVDGASVNVQISSLISSGGCLVKTEFGEVDAQVESLIQVIAQRLGVSK